MDNANKIQQLLEELNSLTLSEFVNKLSWNDIKTYKVKQPSGTPIYRHHITIPQYYVKGSKSVYKYKVIYGGKVDDVDLNNSNYRTYVIIKFKNLIK